MNKGGEREEEEEEREGVGRGFHGGEIVVAERFWGERF